LIALLLDKHSIKIPDFPLFFVFEVSESKIGVSAISRTENDERSDDDDDDNDDDD